MNAFLTGSQIYGTPTDKSDIDLVVSMNDEDLAHLAELVGEVPCNYGETQSLNFRFGKLNLIVTADEAEAVRWKFGTAVLAQQAPVSRERAVEMFKSLKDRAP